MDSRGLRDLLPTTFDGVLYQVGSWFCEVDDIAGTFGGCPIVQVLFASSFFCLTLVRVC